MKQIILMCTLSLSSYYLMAQTSTCGVMLDSLKGTYEGDCNGGKANGHGKAVGADSYEGNFKNGYPDGMGKYTWKNGNYYNGNWKKGVKEGQGVMHVMVNNKDSVVTGFWKKDVYKGEYENPYIIRNTTSEIGRVSVTKIGGKERSVTITVENLQTTGTLTSGSFQASTTMTGEQITRGSYVSKSNTTLTNKDITTFRGVVFPFRGVFNFGNSIFEIEIFEEGVWDISVPINK